MSRSPRPAPRPDVLALLRACKERPRDDLPRLVLADWLEEHGGEAERALAEVTRLGCERRARPAGARESDLIARWWPAWFSPCSQTGGNRGVDRGLFEVRCLAGALRDECPPAPALAEGWHWVHQLVVLAAAQDVDTLAASPVVGQVGWLHLNGERLAPGACRQLAASRHLGGLTGLVLRGCRLGRYGLKELLRSPHWGGLTHLDVAENRLDNAALRGLLAWPGAARLRTLNLEGNWIDDEGLKALAGCRALEGLEALTLDRSRFTMAGIARLFRSPHLRSLRRLEARPDYYWTTAQGGGELALALLDAPFLNCLEELHLPSLGAADEFVQRLAGSPRAAALRVLDLYDTRVGRQTALALLHSAHLPSLRYLRLTVPQDENARALRERFGGGYRG